MTYKGKTDWKYDDIVTEHDLNRIEQGIEDVATETEGKLSALQGEVEQHGHRITVVEEQIASQSTKVTELKKRYQLTEATTHIPIGIPEFHRLTDSLTVIQNSIVLTEGDQYTISEDNLSIIGSWDGSEEPIDFEFKVLKNFVSDLAFFDGYIIQDGTVDKSKLKRDVQEQIDSIDTIEANAKAYTDQQIQLVTETGIPKLVTYPYVLAATADGQTDFAIPLETFDKDTDTVMVVQNSTVLSTDRFSVVDRTVRLNVGIKAGTKIFIQVFKNVPLGPEGAINGGVIAVNSLPSDRVQGFDELFTSVSDGKIKLETAITDKDGTVSKQGDVATFDELDDGIRSIPQAKGNAARDDVLVGRTFSSEVAGIEQTGTMVDRGTVTQTLTTQNGQYGIPQGYHNGNGRVTAQFPNLIAENVRHEVNIGGVVGNYEGLIKLSTFGEVGGKFRLYTDVLNIYGFPPFTMNLTQSNRTATKRFSCDINIRELRTSFILKRSGNQIYQRNCFVTIVNETDNVTVFPRTSITFQSEATEVETLYSNVIGSFQKGKIYAVTVEHTGDINLGTIISFVFGRSEFFVDLRGLANTFKSI